MQQPSREVAVSIGDDHVAVVEIRRPPENYLTPELVGELADILEALDDDPQVRALVLCSEGKHFCAGLDFSAAPADPAGAGKLLYQNAARLFRVRTPIVAAVQGASIGGGLGLALIADFRVADDTARFSANFVRLGFHQGFGLSETLPRLVGPQHAMDLLVTGRRVKADDALRIGLCDRVAATGAARSAAVEWAAEIAGSAPLAVLSIRATLRGDLADRVDRVLTHELAEQERLRATEDFRRGVKATIRRTAPEFVGR